STGPMGSRRVQASRATLAGFLFMGIWRPFMAGPMSSSHAMWTPSVARATSTWASLRGLPPSLIIRSTSSELACCMCLASYPRWSAHAKQGKLRETTSLRCFSLLLRRRRLLGSRSYLVQDLDAVPHRQVDAASERGVQRVRVGQELL